MESVELDCRHLLLLHLNHRDVTLLCISRAPLEKIQAYKRRMGWKFPWVSSFGSDFNYDFGFAVHRGADGERGLPDADQGGARRLEEWAVAVGTDLPTGLIEGPGWNAFVLSDGVVYHTYSRQAPDGALLAPYYYQLLDQVPKGRGDEFRVRRHDEYEQPAAASA
jgi:predicted dithiol-disulfide oxidoreductase (DUF899 family)